MKIKFISSASKLLFSGLISTFGKDLFNNGTNFSWHSKIQCLALAVKGKAP